MRRVKRVVCFAVLEERCIASFETIKTDLKTALSRDTLELDYHIRETLESGKVWNASIESLQRLL